MRNGDESKATAHPCPACGYSASMPKRCPQCQAATSPHGCRPVLSGWYCRANGLVVDPDTLAAPDPDPAHAAASADPVVVELAERQAEAEAAFDVADRTWRAAVAEMAEFEHAGARAADAVMAMHGELLPLSAGTQVRARELSSAVRIAQAARGRAGEALRVAKVKRSEAQERALARAKAELAPALVTP